MRLRRCGDELDRFYGEARAFQILTQSKSVNFTNVSIDIMRQLANLYYSNETFRNTFNSLNNSNLRFYVMTAHFHSPMEATFRQGVP